MRRVHRTDSLIEIELDNGELIRATPDHEFMLRDGRMCPRAALRPGQSLDAAVSRLVPRLRDGVSALERPPDADAPPGGRVESARRLSPMCRGRIAITSTSTAATTGLVNIERMRGYGPHPPAQRADLRGRLRSAEHGAAIRDAFARLARDPRVASSASAQLRRNARVAFWSDDLQPDLADAVCEARAIPVT